MLHRRRFLQTAGAAGLSGWLPALAAASAKDPTRKRNCILLWMSGGPAQTDTFDLKPGHANGGPYREIQTNVPGIRISEHGAETHLHIPGRLDRERAEIIEEMIWQGLHFAQHLRSERLGEFTIGNDLHRSESLALIQLLILYHLFTATATAALDGLGTRATDSAPA